MASGRPSGTATITMTIAYVNISLMLLRMRPASLYSENDEILMIKLTKRAMKIAIAP